MPMKVVICDDEIDYCKKVQEIVQRYLKSRNVSADVSYCTNSKELLEEKDMDVVFMDIKLGHENGIDVARIVNQKFPWTKVVYLTNHIHYASDVYTTHHSYFVTKDQLESHLDQIYECLQEGMSDYPKKIIFSNKGEEFLSLNPHEVIYIERKNRITNIHTQNGVYETQEKITDISDRLPKLYFLRCHNSYIVYIPMIKELLKNEIILDTHQIVPVSRNYRKRTRDAFIKWVKLQNK
jgi:DNA-binding LytR/AlgR family response regulator